MVNRSEQTFGPTSLRRVHRRLARRLGAGRSESSRRAAPRDRFRRTHRGGHEVRARCPVEVVEVEAERGSQGRCDIEQGHPPRAATGCDARTAREQQAAPMVVAGAPLVVRNPHDTDRRRPHGLDGRGAVPFDDEVAEGVGRRAFVLFVGEDDVGDRGFAGFHVDELGQPVREPAERVAVAVLGDPTVRLALFEVQADRTAHGVVGCGPPPADAEPRDVLVEVAEWDTLREPAAHARGRGEGGRARRGGNVAQPEVRGAGHPSAMVVAGCVLVESPQDRVEHLRAVVVRPHAVAEQHIDGGVFVEAVEVAPDRLVEQRVHAPQRVAAEVGPPRGVVPRMALVVDVPELVPRAVTFAEHREEEVPVPPRPSRSNESARFASTPCCMASSSAAFSAAVRCSPARCAIVTRRVVRQLAVQQRSDGVRAVSRVELVELARGIRVRAGMTVVTAPLDQLHAVQVLGDAGVRRVERDDTAARVREPLPDRPADRRSDRSSAARSFRHVSRPRT